MPNTTNQIFQTKVPHTRSAAQLLHVTFTWSTKMEVIIEALLLVAINAWNVSYEETLHAQTIRLSLIQI